MFVLNQQPSIANNILARLRDQNLQKDPAAFRNGMQQLGTLMSYELSKSLSFEDRKIQTPLAETKIAICSSQVVLVAVLRAAIPYYSGFLQTFPDAESAFVGASRVERSGEELDVDMGYFASPNLDGKEMIICDPMLATGKSILKTVDGLSKFGTPKVLHIASIFAAPEGVSYLQNHLKVPHQFWLGSLESGLNDQFYIVPGLGDAGDLAFGPKL